MYRVGVLEIDIHMPTAHSLKERRSLLKGPIERARSKFNASVVELPHGNGWQTATVAVALVSGEENDARKLLDKIVNFFENSDGLVILDNRVEFL
jgi:uncharacterized protein YlxP (DUF503 family)